MIRKYSKFFLSFLCCVALSKNFGAFYQENILKPDIENFALVPTETKTAFTLSMDIPIPEMEIDAYISEIESRDMQITTPEPKTFYCNILRKKNFTGLKIDSSYCAGKKIDHNFKPSIDQNGCTELHYSVAYQNITRTEELLSYGHSPNHVNIDKRTPLHIAAIIRNLELAELLIIYGAVCDIQDICHKCPKDYVYDQTSELFILLNQPSENMQRS